MSAKPAAAAPPASADAPPKKGKGKLVMILAVVLVLAGAGGGGAFFFLGKKKPAEGHEEVAQEAPAHAPDSKHPPVYMPLENMVINLADDSGDRFAQIGITLDVDNEKTVEKIKGVLPMVRARILMTASSRSAAELLKRDGKEKLAEEIGVEVARAIGYEVDDVAPSKKKKASEDDEDEPPRKKKRRAAYTPIHGVHFTSFLIQ